MEKISTRATAKNWVSLCKYVVLGIICMCLISEGLSLLNEPNTGLVVLGVAALLIALFLVMFAFKLFYNEVVINVADKCNRLINGEDKNDENNVGSH